MNEPVNLNELMPDEEDEAALGQGIIYPPYPFDDDQMGDTLDQYDLDDTLDYGSEMMMKKKTKGDSDTSNLDRITDLPWDVLGNILGRVPIRTAVRTSILSRKWRYKWVSLSQLRCSFFDILSLNLPIYEAALQIKLVNIINGILLRFTGPIHKFELSQCCKPSAYDLDQWLLFLSRNGVKELNLSHAANIFYKLPSCLFSCQQLSYLVLTNCILEPPPTVLKGFNNLISLVLNVVRTSDDVFESLIRGCPVLEVLKLVNIDGLFCIKIDAPNLKSLELNSQFDDISIGNSPALNVVSFRMWYKDITSAKQLEQRRTNYNLVRVLGGLPGLECLSIWDKFLEYLAMDEVPERLPTSCNHLKLLNLNFSNFNLDEISVTLSILRSSPNLQEIHIYVDSIPNDVEMQLVEDTIAQDISDISFTQLRFVCLYIWGMRCEVEFIKFLLSHSPVLEIISIHKKGTLSDCNVLMELLELERASVRAKVKYTSCHRQRC